jgi:hypothetical protein
LSSMSGVACDAATTAPKTKKPVIKRMVILPKGKDIVPFDFAKRNAQKKGRGQMRPRP